MDRFNLVTTVKHGATVISSKTRTLDLAKAADVCARLFPGANSDSHAKQLSDGHRLTEIFSPAEKSDVIVIVTVCKAKA